MEFNDAQKKMLEKIYARIFDQNQLTDEGKMLCREAQIKAEDLKHRTLDDFKSEIQIEDVAKIRFTHFQ